MGKSKLTAKERYDYLIKARNFHYENFNKWLTYFYVAIGALFVGYYTISTKSGMENERILLIVTGYITSLFWYWSSKGYYFWNINFITLVNHYEKKVLKLKKKERVYFIFANKKTQNNYLSPISGANVSTSKIAILFSFIISVVWLTILLLELRKIFSIECTKFYLFCIILISIVVTLLFSSLIPKTFLTSKIDHFPDLKIEQ